MNRSDLSICNVDSHSVAKCLRRFDYEKEAAEWKINHFPHDYIKDFEFLSTLECVPHMATIFHFGSNLTLEKIKNVRKRLVFEKR